MLIGAAPSSRKGHMDLIVSVCSADALIGAAWLHLGRYRLSASATTHERQERQRGRITSVAIQAMSSSDMSSMSGTVREAAMLLRDGPHL